MLVSELLPLVTRAGAIADMVVAWLATYALHSTVLILIALVATARRAPWRLATTTRDVFWKSALVGGFLTASLQMAVDAAPLGGTWKLRPAPTGETADVRVVVTSGDAHKLAPVMHPLFPVPILGQPATSPFTLPLPSIGTSDQGFPFAFITGFSGASMYVALAAMLWLTGVAVMLWRYDRARAQLDRLLGDRTPMENGIAGSVLKEAMRRAGVARSIRLTASDRLESPAVIDSDEICVPRRFLTEVNILEQESILAHELAHVVRRDTWWLRIANLVVHAFFFQPLNRVARARLIEVAEFSADEWAVRTTGAPLHLAKGLATVASWLSTRMTALPAMASERGSVLVRRVTALTTSQVTRPAHGRSLALAIALTMLTGAAVAAPRIDLTNVWSSPGVRHLVIRQQIEKGRGASITRVVDFTIKAASVSPPTGDARRVSDVIIRRADDDVPSASHGSFIPRVVVVRRVAFPATSD